MTGINLTGGHAPHHAVRPAGGAPPTYRRAVWEAACKRKGALMRCWDYGDWRPHWGVRLRRWPGGGGRGWGGHGGAGEAGGCAAGWVADRRQSLEGTVHVCLPQHGCVKMQGYEAHSALQRARQ